MAIYGLLSTRKEGIASCMPTYFSPFRVVPGYGFITGSGPKWLLLFSHQKMHFELFMLQWNWTLTSHNCCLSWRDNPANWIESEKGILNRSKIRPRESRTAGQQWQIINKDQTIRTCVTRSLLNQKTNYSWKIAGRCVSHSMPFTWDELLLLLLLFSFHQWEDCEKLIELPRFLKKKRCCGVLSRSPVGFSV